MSKIIAPRRSLILPSRFRQKQGGFIMNPFAHGSAPASDPYWANVVSLLHFDGADASTTFTDHAGRSWGVGGQAQMDTAQSKFGGASGLFDGTTDYLNNTEFSAFELGSGNFTIEFWIRTTQTTSYAALVGKSWVSAPWAGGWSIFLNGASSGPMQIWCADFSTGSPFMTASGTGYRDGNWHHVAWVRNGTSFVLYIDGVSVATATSSFAFAAANKAMVIGDDLTFSGRGYNGHIDDFRFTKGVARYTAAFTPPTAPFPNS